MVEPTKEGKRTEITLATGSTVGCSYTQRSMTTELLHTRKQEASSTFFTTTTFFFFGGGELSLTHNARAIAILLPFPLFSFLSLLFRKEKMEMFAHHAEVMMLFLNWFKSLATGLTSQIRVWVPHATTTTTTFRTSLWLAVACRPLWDIRN